MSNILFKIHKRFFNFTQNENLPQMSIYFIDIQRNANKDVYQIYKGIRRGKKDLKIQRKYGNIVQWWTYEFLYSRLFKNVK